MRQTQFHNPTHDFFRSPSPLRGVEALQRPLSQLSRKDLERYDGTTVLEALRRSDDVIATAELQLRAMHAELLNTIEMGQRVLYELDHLRERSDGASDNDGRRNGAMTTKTGYSERLRREELQESLDSAIQRCAHLEHQLETNRHHMASQEETARTCDRLNRQLELQLAELRRDKDATDAESHRVMEWQTHILEQVASLRSPLQGLDGGYLPPRPTERGARAAPPRLTLHECREICEGARRALLDFARLQRSFREVEERRDSAIAELATYQRATAEMAEDANLACDRLEPLAAENARLRSAIAGTAKEQVFQLEGRLVEKERELAAARELMGRLQRDVARSGLNRSGAAGAAAHGTHHHSFESIPSPPPTAPAGRSAGAVAADREEFASVITAKEATITALRAENSALMQEMERSARERREENAAAARADHSRQLQELSDTNRQLHSRLQDALSSLDRQATDHAIALEEARAALRDAYARIELLEAQRDEVSRSGNAALVDATHITIHADDAAVSSAGAVGTSQILELRDRIHELESEVAFLDTERQRLSHALAGAEGERKGLLSVLASVGGGGAVGSRRSGSAHTASEDRERAREDRLAVTTQQLIAQLHAEHRDYRERYAVPTEVYLRQQQDLQALKEQLEEVKKEAEASTFRDGILTDVAAEVEGLVGQIVRATDAIKAGAANADAAAKEIHANRHLAANALSALHADGSSDDDNDDARRSAVFRLAKSSSAAAGLTAAGEQKALSSAFTFFASLLSSLLASAETALSTCALDNVFSGGGGIAGQHHAASDARTRYRAAALERYRREHGALKRARHASAQDAAAAAERLVAILDEMNQQRVKEVMRIIDNVERRREAREQAGVQEHRHDELRRQQFERQFESKIASLTSELDEQRNQRQQLERQCEVKIATLTGELEEQRRQRQKLLQDHQHDELRRQQLERQCESRIVGLTSELDACKRQLQDAEARSAEATRRSEQHKRALDEHLAQQRSSVGALQGQVEFERAERSLLEQRLKTLEDERDLQQQQIVELTAVTASYRNAERRSHHETDDARAREQERQAENQRLKEDLRRREEALTATISQLEDELRTARSRTVMDVTHSEVRIEELQARNETIRLELDVALADLTAASRQMDLDQRTIEDMQNRLAAARSTSPGRDSFGGGIDDSADRHSDTPGARSVRHRLIEVEQEVENVSAERDSLMRRVATLTTERDELLRQTEVDEAQIKALQHTIEQLERRLKSVEAERDPLRRQLHELIQHSNEPSPASTLNTSIKNPPLAHSASSATMGWRSASGK
jgi:DNA repair exonuclease SbcCD ATPase subunit